METHSFASNLQQSFVGLDNGDKPLSESMTVVWFTDTLLVTQPQWVNQHGYSIPYPGFGAKRITYPVIPLNC